MAQVRDQLVQYKQKCKEYELKLKEMEQEMQFKTANESRADEKISALNKIHAEKTKNLMNSITLLKKENRALERKQMGGQQSKLIERLNKDIAEQETVISILRKEILELAANKDSIMDIVDDKIIQEFNKGPAKIKAPSREEMNIELKKLRAKIGGKKNLQNNSQAINSQNQSQVSMNQSQSTMKESLMEQSIISQSADSTENLLSRIQELVQENEELKLNLQASLENKQQYEEFLEQKSKEINELKSVRVDYQQLLKKYEAYQSEVNKQSEQRNDNYIMNQDKELRVEELEITNKQLQQKLRFQEETMLMEREHNQAKIEELEKKKKMLDNNNIALKNQLDQTALKNNNLSNELAKLKNQYKELNDNFQKNENQYKSELERIKDSKEHLENKLADRQQEYEVTYQEITKLKQKLEQTQQELSEAKSKNKQLESFGDMQLITGEQNINTMNVDNKEMRNKVKQLTKKEIELQDQIEALKQELQFREQREKVLNYVNNKKLGSVQEQQLKAQYQKEIKQRYESKITKLVLQVKELEQHNNQLQEIHKLIQPQDDIVASDFSSDINLSVSLAALEQVQPEQNSDINDLNSSKAQVIQNDKNQLKNKLLQLATREIELKKNVRELVKQIDYYKQKSKQGTISQEEFENRMLKMHSEYDKIITQLANKISDLKFKEVNLSGMDSNIGSSLISNMNVHEDQLKNLDSNISFSQAEIQKEYFDMSKIDSNISDLISDKDQLEKEMKKSNKSQQAQNMKGSSKSRVNFSQKPYSMKKSGPFQMNSSLNSSIKLDQQIKEEDQELLDQISSGISGISGMKNEIKKHKSSKYIFLQSFCALLGAFYYGYALGELNMALSKIMIAYDLHETDLQDLYEGILTSAMPLGGTFGCIIAGILMKNRGRRSLMIFSDIIGIIIGFLFIIPNFYIGVISRFIMGLIVGSNSTIGPLYVREISPVSLSAQTGIMNQGNVSFGILVGYLLGLQFPIHTLENCPIFPIFYLLYKINDYDTNFQI
ncbi:Major facilitator superfamily domain, general substrate transporter [Pseudocohnilembus persalinus]|uniref:Major facilitator superfamily domain, general substrate transporter n=1 Tax=Pseudocohnilembus persalinus TaxID=266149 RepID=A0A0V0QF45_PSEPJ|nr:Major facilitator superfamily domain, general substrate transporter [Pseudocohnilembus persalinus]|eukprot:KRX00752.1 Major facilitator superfamily domain, general substrate transporter [Pseudocohnilembus persalinus]